MFLKQENYQLCLPIIAFQNIPKKKKKKKNKARKKINLKKKKKKKKGKSHFPDFFYLAPEAFEQYVEYYQQ